VSVFSKGAECRRLKAGSVIKDQRKRGAEAPLYRTHSITKLLRDHQERALKASLYPYAFDSQAAMKHAARMRR
jgi:hypothetical protein